MWKSYIIFIKDRGLNNYTGLKIYIFGRRPNTADQLFKRQKNSQINSQFDFYFLLRTFVWLCLFFHQSFWHFCKMFVIISISVFYVFLWMWYFFLCSWHSHLLISSTVFFILPSMSLYIIYKKSTLSNLVKI